MADRSVLRRFFKYQNIANHATGVLNGAKGALITFPTTASYVRIRNNAGYPIRVGWTSPANKGYGTDAYDGVTGLSTTVGKLVENTTVAGFWEEIEMDITTLQVIAVGGTLTNGLEIEAWFDNIP